MPNHPAPPLVADEPELIALRALARAGRTEQRLATRARIVLRAVDGEPNNRIASELGVAPMTVLLGVAGSSATGWRGSTTRPDRGPSGSTRAPTVIG